MNCKLLQFCLMVAFFDLCFGFCDNLLSVVFVWVEFIGGEDVDSCEEKIDEGL